MYIYLITSMYHTLLVVSEYGETESHESAEAETYVSNRGGH